MEFKTGDYVKVKEGTKLESGEKISNWAGQVLEIYREQETCRIELDSLTLNILDDKYILECIQEGAEPYEYIFEWKDLIKSERRDTEKERAIARERIKTKLIELDEEYEPDYDESQQEKWIEEFQKSEYFERLNEYRKENAGFIADTFMSYMYNYEYVVPNGWNATNVEEVCLNIIPRKVIAEIELFENYGEVLIKFLEFLEGAGHIGESSELRKRVNEIKEEIPKEASNPSNWGMAKTFMMGAQEAGYDISDEKEINTFMNIYNQQIRSNIENEPKRSIKETPKKKIGRNEKITVRYTDGTIKENIKYKIVQQDLLTGKCKIIKK